jgi:hypothetical protein
MACQDGLEGRFCHMLVLPLALYLNDRPSHCDRAADTFMRVVPASDPSAVEVFSIASTVLLAAAAVAAAAAAAANRRHHR